MNDYSENLEKYYTLNVLLKNLHAKLYQTKYLGMENVVIYNYYMDIPISQFKVCYRDGLVIYNEQNNIKVSTICPELSAMDNIASKLLSTNPVNVSIKPTTLSPSLNQPIKFPPRSAYIPNAKLVNNNQSYCQSKSSQPKSSQPKSSQSKPQAIIQEAVKNTSEKFRIFESDKRSYVKMKNDILAGALTMQQMNPAFVIKYQIFKILESRNNLDIISDKNIDNEYEIFTKMYDECIIIDNESPKKDVVVLNKVYVPHNYQYMSDDKKTDHAKKYKMTKQQFEEKYINGMGDDDIIENRINNNPTKPNNNDNNNNDSDSDYTDSDSESSDQPEIDTAFIELTKEYNRTLNKN